MPVYRVCVAYLLREHEGRRQVLLGRKKRGLGTGHWVGLGGKLEPGEGVQEAAPDAVALATRLALLPPEAITEDVAATLGRGLDALVRTGLVTPLTDGTLAMHRVLGRAVRSTDADVAGAATDVLGSEPARDVLARFGDIQTTGLLAGALGSTADGITLARLGALQELHDGAVELFFGPPHRAHSGASS